MGQRPHGAMGMQLLRRERAVGVHPPNRTRGHPLRPDLPWNSSKGEGLEKGGAHLHQGAVGAEKRVPGGDWVMIMEEEWGQEMKGG